MLNNVAVTAQVVCSTAEKNLFPDLEVQRLFTLKELLAATHVSATMLSTNLLNSVHFVVGE